MDIMFILAQVCGLIVLFLMIASVWFNDNKKIVFINILANIFATAQYFLLSALTAAIVSIVNVLRCFIFYLYKKKGKKPSLPILILFEIVSIVTGALSWQNWWSLIPILMSVVYTYGLWQDNTFVIKLSAGISGVGWTIYNIVVKAYVGAAQTLTQFISSTIAIIKDKINKNKTETAPISEAEIAEPESEQADISSNKEIK